MANEISKSLQFKASKNGATISLSKAAKKDMAGDELVSATQEIGTSSETVDFADISGVPSTVIIQNLDATNFVEIGGNSGLTVFKLKISAGDFAQFEPTSGTLYAKADTAAVRIQLFATEA